MDYVLGEVQTDPAPAVTRHAVAAEVVAGSWGHAICPAAPRVWVHMGPMPFPGLYYNPDTTCAECVNLAESAPASEPKRWPPRGWRRQRE